jgi:hypothetical protein
VCREDLVGEKIPKKSKQPHPSVRWKALAVTSTEHTVMCLSEPSANLGGTAEIRPMLSTTWDFLRVALSHAKCVLNQNRCACT